MFDGLTDCDELYGWGVYGWRTNPLSADTDHDFVSDSAEIKTYTAELEDRWDLSKPGWIYFDEHADRVAAAQIAFAISFGESASSGSTSYGISNESLTDLSVEVVKYGDNKLLYRGKTEGERGPSMARRSRSCTA